jgi:hypothetical protein
MFPVGETNASIPEDPRFAISDNIKVFIRIVDK